MDNLARMLNSEQVFLEYGKVKFSQNQTFTVETDSGAVAAKKSVNCIMEPLPGDMVLVSHAALEKCYILNILEREAAGPADLVFEGDVNLKAKGGRLRFAAQEGIDLVTVKDTALVSAQLSVYSEEAEVSVQHFSFFGTFFQGQIERIKLIGWACDFFFDRVFQKLKRSYRRVEELEEVKAGQLNYLVKKLMSLRGKYSVLTAEEDVRIDGDKILMG
jgi:hypothetical protein